jgi:hypothetical protein
MASVLIAGASSGIEIKLPKQIFNFRTMASEKGSGKIII